MTQAGTLVPLADFGANSHPQTSVRGGRSPVLAFARGRQERTPNYRPPCLGLGLLTFTSGPLLMVSYRRRGVVWRWSVTGFSSRQGNS